MNNEQCTYLYFWGRNKMKNQTGFHATFNRMILLRKSLGSLQVNQTAMESFWIQIFGQESKPRKPHIQLGPG